MRLRNYKNFSAILYFQCAASTARWPVIDTAQEKNRNNRYIKITTNRISRNSMSVEKDIAQKQLAAEYICNNNSIASSQQVTRNKTCKTNTDKQGTTKSGKRHRFQSLRLRYCMFVFGNISYTVKCEYYRGTNKYIHKI